MERVTEQSSPIAKSGTDSVPRHKGLYMCKSLRLKAFSDTAACTFVTLGYIGNIERFLTLHHVRSLRTCM
ncbi:hypothetical protein DPMN_175004 [Dreissena polymorpha]|uniref:Uncharacterized protein n=1 Tax=Dreissena polymorpha TaxID=45954 RepID=A0A9D4E6F0_DREPO|nr:hypothetical protein DPMN_175004 [Dreissena polymorpha]